MAVINEKDLVSTLQKLVSNNNKLVARVQRNRNDIEEIAKSNRDLSKLVDSLARTVIDNQKESIDLRELIRRQPEDCARGQNLEGRVQRTEDRLNDLEDEKSSHAANLKWKIGIAVAIVLPTLSLLVTLLIQWGVIKP